MSDRELLTLAAKAARIVDIGHHWNPLESDGEAFRLACILRMTLTIERETVSAVVPSRPEITEPVGSSRARATRRAIVRAAASLSGTGSKEGRDG